MKGNVKNGKSALVHHATGEVDPNGVKGRTGSRKGNRLAARLAAHAEFPCAADGTEFNKSKPTSRKPGSLNPRKH